MAEESNMPDSQPPITSTDVAEILKTLPPSASEEIRKQFKEVQRRYESQLVGMREALEEERAKTKQFIQQMTQQMRQKGGVGPAGSSEEVDHLRSQNEQLSATVTQLQNQLNEMGVTALREYEQQLNTFREQLETAQKALADEEAKLKEKVKETDAQLAGERAEILKDRVMLQKVRAEVRNELLEAQREAEALEHSGVYHGGKRDIRAVASPPDKAEPAKLTDKIKGFLRRIGDS